MDKAASQVQGSQFELMGGRTILSTMKLLDLLSEATHRHAVRHAKPHVFHETD